MSGARTSARRRALALLVAVACAVALAQGPGSGQGGPPREAGPPETAAGAGPGAGAGHVLVAALRFASDGTLVIDGGRVDAPPPWPRFLAPGMWFRALGSWDGSVFRATEITVTRPAVFSYYRGPAAPLDLGEGWVEAWFAAPGAEQGTRLFELRRVTPAEETLALLRSEGSHWLALPPGLRPPLPPDADGWGLFHGRAEGSVVSWGPPEPFR